MKKILSLIVICLMFAIKSMGSHAMGGDLTYVCNGNGLYTFTFSFYRDCSGIPASTTYSVVIQNNCGFPNNTVPLVPVPNTPTQISPVCLTDTSTCDGGVYTGIQEWVYQGMAIIPGPCNEWIFSVLVNARNNSITTVPTASSSNLFIYSTLNNLDTTTCNNSPTFSNKPIPFACVGQQFCFNHGASDVDGDSLSYELITPRDGYLLSDTLTYSPPYSGNQPVLSNPPMSFNPSTGDFCMSPTQPDITVMAVLVKEYRNGILIGSVERDIQITVLACNNNIPSASGINGTPIFNTSTCINDTICFWVRSVDPNISDTTFLTWDGSIPNATFTTTNGQRDSALFCWVPTLSDYRSSPYCFTVTVQDNNCPYVGIQVYSYCITVKNVTADAGLDITIPCGLDTTLFGYGIGGDGNYNYVWDPGNINQQQLNGVGAGVYILTVTSNGCSNTDTINVIQGQDTPTSNFSFLSNCDGVTQFTDMSTITGNIINGWYWNFGDGSSDTIQNPLHTYVNGNYSVSLEVSTPTGCQSIITNQIQIVKDIPSSNFSTTNVCYGDTTIFTSNPNLEYSWDFGDGSYSLDQNPKHIYNLDGTYQVKLITTNIGGCSDTTIKSIDVFEQPIPTFTSNNSCEGNPIRFNGQSSTAINSWYWNFGDGVYTYAVSPTHTYDSVGTYYPTLTVSSTNGCSNSITNSVIIYEKPIVDFSSTNNCFGYPTLLINNSSTTIGTITQYQWDFGDGSGSNDENPTHVYLSGGLKNISLSVTTDSGCVSNKIKNNSLEVYNLPDPLYWNDSHVASDLNLFVTFTPKSSKYNSYSWDFGDGEYSTDVKPKHEYNSVGTYETKLIVVDTNGCVDSSESEIKIFSTSTLYVPNSFSPNNDGINDFFKISTTNIDKLYVQIFDRWGLKIYEWKGVDGYWDGKVNGNKVQSDTYICKIIAVDSVGKSEQLIKSITIIK